MSFEAHSRQILRLAIDAAESWGDRWPRRWWVRHGGLILAVGKDAPELNKAYIATRKRIAPLVPKSVYAQD